MKNINSINSKVRISIKYLISPEKLKVYTYTASNIVAMLLAFIVTLLLTRWVAPEIYGQYKYATNFVLMMPAFFGFGIHFSGSRIVAEDKANEKHPIAATGILLMVIIGVIVSIGLYFLIHINGFLNIEGLNAIYNIRIVFPFVALFLIEAYVMQLFQGTGKIYQLSILSFFKYLILLLGICFGKYFYSPITFEFCVWIFLLSNLIVVIPTLMRLDYHITDLRGNLKRLLGDVRHNGIMVYISSIVTTSASTVIGLICGSIYGYTEYGYYSLALSLAHFFTFISSAMAVVKFRDNVHERFIKNKDITFMITINAITYIVFLLLIRKIFFLFFSAEYEPAIEYLIVLALAYIVSGLAIFYNRFFIARGLGIIVMRCSICVAIVNIICSVVLIPKFAIKGLVIASLIAAAFNFGQYIFSYTRYAKKERTNMII